MDTKIQQKKTSISGFTLIELLVGVALMLVLFVGIYGVMRLSIILIATTSADIGAVALANEQLEFLRSLPYDDVGTVSGIPAGSIPQNEVISLNNVSYNRRTFIEYVDDPKDGLGVSDSNSITADYKVAKIEITWTVHGMNESYALITNIVPKGVESLAGGGTLTVNVFDAVGAPVTNAEVHILNDTTTSTIDVTSYSNTSGIVTFPGAPAASDYQVFVTKAGYSSAQTYEATSSNPNPNPGPVSVVEAATTEISFAIDQLSTKTIRTFEPIRTTTYSDMFTDDSGLSATSSTVVSGGQIELYDAGSGYGLATGTAKSINITSPYLVSWDELRFTDNTPPSTNALYHIYYDNAGTPTLVPDGVLPGNSGGFKTSPVDLSGISTTTYGTLIIGVGLRTADASTTPAVFDWELDYDEGPIPLPDIPFTMRGTKTIGSDGGGNPIYKFDMNMQTDGSGVVSTTTLEWDSYTITVDDGATGYDTSEICQPQPLAISPATSVTTDITLVPDTTNTLLVTVRDDVGDVLPGASVRLHRTSGYDTTLPTGSCGQAFFENVPLGTIAGSNAYDLDISASGFTTDNQTNIEVQGVSTAGSTLFP